jgi:hypothetical protein
MAAGNRRPCGFALAEGRAAVSTAHVCNRYRGPRGGTAVISASIHRPERVMRRRLLLNGGVPLPACGSSHGLVRQRFFSRAGQRSWDSYPSQFYSCPRVSGRYRPSSPLAVSLAAHLDGFIRGVGRLVPFSPTTDYDASRTRLPSRLDRTRPATKRDDRPRAKSRGSWVYNSRTIRAGFPADARLPWVFYSRFRCLDAGNRRARAGDLLARPSAFGRLDASRLPIRSWDFADDAKDATADVRCRGHPCRGPTLQRM